MTRTSLQPVPTHRHGAFGCEDAATLDCADCIWDEMLGNAASSPDSFHTSVVARRTGWLGNPSHWKVFAFASVVAGHSDISCMNNTAGWVHCCEV
jgi:hypothetical protein